MSGGEGKGKGGGEPQTLNRRERAKRWKSNAHPFFWALWALLVPAIAAAYVAPAAAPGYALGSVWLYRLEVGGAFFVGLFVFVLLFWLGYSGRSIRDLQLPGGGGIGVPNPDPNLDDAAEGLAGYRQKTDRRLDKLEDTITILTPKGAVPTPEANALALDEGASDEEFAREKSLDEETE